MKSLRMYLLLLLLLGGIGAYADDVEFDVTGITSGKNYYFLWHGKCNPKRTNFYKRGMEWLLPSF